MRGRAAGLGRNVVGAGRVGTRRRLAGAEGGTPGCGRGHRPVPVITGLLRTATPSAAAGCVGRRGMLRTAGRRRPSGPAGGDRRGRHRVPGIDRDRGPAGRAGMDRATVSARATRRARATVSAGATRAAGSAGATRAAGSAGATRAAGSARAAGGAGRGRAGAGRTAVDRGRPAPLVGAARRGGTASLVDAVVHVDGPVPGGLVARGRGRGRARVLVPELVLIVGSWADRRTAPARTADRRRAGRTGTAAGRLVDGRVHGLTAARVAGVALAGQGFPLPGDLVDPGGFVIPAVGARPGAPAVHRAPSG
ncbi:hypothetical protein FHR83_007683 [Actinoplanes campanulatus]|uniref:Uncharacterized protein n=1 Tax=Actinoplanes campanulatus TaxID=113559 RepID=A0A7W5APN2_9ACTN|nr:hypothetical protein [Actinoplanes campanulatus]